MWFLILLLSLFLIAYKYLTGTYEFWKKRGVPNPPVSFLFGNITDCLLARKSLGQKYTQVYRDFPNLRYVGFFKIREPAIVVRDADLVRTLLIKEFGSFHDNDFNIDETVDPIFAKNPFVLKGEKWKYSRNQLTPIFTGKKLKAMFPLINEVGKKLVNYLNNHQEQEVEAKEICLRFTTDSVASCMFGIEGYSFEDGKADLLTLGKKMFAPSKLLAFKHVIVIVLPYFAKLFDFKFFSDEIAEYFRIVIRKSLKYRDDNNIVRGDFLDNMRELRIKLGSEDFSDEEIVGHAGSLFGDGFETSSTALSFILFELAANPEAQSNLREYIDEILQKNNGELNYEDIVSLQYLDCVFKEALRLHPPAPFLAKVCTKNFKFPSPYYGDDSSEIEISKGMPIYIPLYAIHRDSKYYSDPEKFIPERFLGQIKNSPFLTFGEGPRFCLGEKFANLQVKTCVAYIITNFEIRLSKRTNLPLEIDPLNFMLRAKDGIWLYLDKRN